MVIKGGSRSGGSQLAGHLLRADTNERVEVVELTGVATTTLPAALREMMAVATGTRCTRPLYHASINTGPGETLTAAQKVQAVTALEKRLGLAGHPRAVVEHRKGGRDHLHVVWSRIDLATMTAVHDGFNYRRHEEVARQLERAFGHHQVQGAHVGREGRARPARTLPTAELQQAARTGVDPETITAELTRLWRAADSGKAFVAALHDAGYVLAQGERRGFCVVDSTGGVHSLARRLDGVRTKEVNVRLAGIDLADLPTVAQARDQLRQRPPAAGHAPPPTQGGRRGAGAVLPATTLPAPSQQAPQRPSYAAENQPTARQTLSLTPDRPQARHQLRQRSPASAGQATPAAPSSASYGGAPVVVAGAAGVKLDMAGNVLGSGRSRPSPPPARPARSSAPLSPPMTSPDLKPGLIIRGGGSSAPPRTPVKRGQAEMRPFARLLGQIVGVPHEVVAWALEAKRKLIAFSCATGEYVLPELEHLARIISGAYLEAGLSVTGKQRQSSPAP